MPDFGSLLRKPAFEAKKPELLPISPNYIGIVGKYELGESKSVNKTPFVRFMGNFISWPDDIDEGDRNCDISKRTWRRDFFLSEDALFRLDEFLRGMGIGEAGALYEDLIPQLIGQQVRINVSTRMDQKTNEIFQDIKDIGAL